MREKGRAPFAPHTGAWPGSASWRKSLQNVYADLLKTVHGFLLSWDENGATQLCH